MSEFGQHFRIYGVDEKAALDIFKATSGSKSGLEVSENQAQKYTTLNFWNMDIQDRFIADLNRQKHTYLSYIYHTGAGCDELQIYVEGELALTEDLGELYQFGTDKVFADLEYDYDRRDDQGRSFIKADPPIREEQLKILAGKMGPSATILHGWEDCIKEDLPLSYLAGLGW